MRVYEEYFTAKAKHQAQRGAKRGKPTGKARGYIFVFEENGCTTNGGYDSMGSVYGNSPEGATPAQAGLASGVATLEYLRATCRRVGAKHLPKAWRNVYDDLTKPE